jgi:hypothetical protein
MLIQHEQNSLWTGVDNFYSMVDALEHRPDWSEEVVVTTLDSSESFIVHKWNPIDIVRHLLGLVHLCSHMHYSLEKHTTVTLDSRRVHMYSEMWMGKWWWRMQVRSK